MRYFVGEINQKHRDCDQICKRSFSEEGWILLLEEKVTDN